MRKQCFPASFSFIYNIYSTTTSEYCCILQQHHNMVELNYIHKYDSPSSFHFFFLAHQRTFIAINIKQNMREDD